MSKIVQILFVAMVMAIICLVNANPAPVASPQFGGHGGYGRSWGGNRGYGGFGGNYGGFGGGHGGFGGHRGYGGNRGYGGYGGHHGGNGGYGIFG